MGEMHGRRSTCGQREYEARGMRTKIGFLDKLNAEQMPLPHSRRRLFALVGGA
jgi:hypothetical protein